MFKQEMDQALELSNKCLYAAENDDGETQLTVRAATNSDPVDASKMLELPLTTCGERHYLWRAATLKGCVHLFMPAGEVQVQGNTRQRAFWMGLISEFTESLTGPVMISDDEGERNSKDPGNGA